MPNNISTKTIAAEVCAENDWTPGTVLVGGRYAYEIRCIGKYVLLVGCVGHRIGDTWQTYDGEQEFVVEQHQFKQWKPADARTLCAIGLASSDGVYGDLEPGAAGSPLEFFSFGPSGDHRLMLRTDEGHVRPDSYCYYASNDEPIYRVKIPDACAILLKGGPYSVVEHEEPETHVAWTGSWYVVKGKNTNRTLDIDEDDLRGIVAQGAALLCEHEDGCLRVREQQPTPSPEELDTILG